MSVVGIDLGSQSTKIGVARNKGIDIVRFFAPPRFSSRLKLRGLSFPHEYD
jgi:sugar (pentulose or hexulose) kinase